MQRQITRGASAGAGLIFHVFAQDSASTTGAGKASVAFGSWTCRYIRNGETISGAITPEDITTIGTYAAPTAATNIRIKAVDNTNMIGVYELQIHADWVNTTNSCQSLTIYLTATGVAVLPLQIPLAAFNLQDAVRGGLTALPNANAEAAGGLFTRGTGAGQINQAANGQIDANAVAISGDSGAADNLETAADGGSYNLGGGGVVAASVTGAVGSVTGNVGGNVAGSVGSVTARVTANVDQIGGAAQSLTDLKDFADTGYDPSTHKVAGVVLADTVTTYTGNTPQTGDTYALANGANGFVATKADTAAILDDTGTAGVVVAAASKTGYRLSATGVGDILTTALTESYAADGAAPTLSQAIFAIQQMMQERAISTTTMTVKKLDGSTAAMTFTLDDANSPTSITRAS
jgi:hypothetical protein